MERRGLARLRPCYKICVLQRLQARPGSMQANVAELGKGDIVPPQPERAPQAQRLDGVSLHARLPARQRVSKRTQDGARADKLHVSALSAPKSCMRRLPA